MRARNIVSLLVLTGLLAACAHKPCDNGVSRQCQQLRTEYVNELDKRDIKVARLVSKTLIFLPSDKIFADNTAELSARGQRDLNEVIIYLRIYPGAKIKVSAYTDNVMPAKLRNKLSERQAREVAGYLWSEGIPAKYQRLNYHGRGDKNPITSNRYYIGMAENRRVVITVHPSCCQAVGAGAGGDKNVK